MKRKAEITWETIVKLILALIVFVFLIGLVWMSRDKIALFIGNLIDMIRVH